MTLMKSIFALGIATVLTACAPVNFLNNITPSSTFNLEKNVSYGESDRNKLDIYASKTPKNNAPVIVFVHGGSWEEGSKDIYKFLGEGYTREGYDVVIPNYRLYPEAKFPSFVHDVAEAVAFAAKRYPDRSLAVMGHSAGGHIVTLLGTNSDYFKTAGVDMCSRISSIVGLAPPTGAYPLLEEPYITIFPERFGGKDAPLNNVSAPSPAMFLMNGGKDTTVGPKNSEELAAAVRARGGQAEFKLYPSLNHTDPVKVMSKFFDSDSTLKADVMAFIDIQAQKQGGFCQ